MSKAKLRYVRYEGVHGILTDPVLQEQDEMGWWYDVPVTILPDTPKEEPKEKPKEESKDIYSRILSNGFQKQ